MNMMDLSEGAKTCVKMIEGAYIDHKGWSRYDFTAALRYCVDDTEGRPRTEAEELGDSLEMSKEGFWTRAKNEAEGKYYHKKGLSMDNLKPSQKLVVRSVYNLPCNNLQDLHQALKFCLDKYQKV
jgi:hypothetical protein